GRRETSSSLTPKSPRIARGRNTTSSPVDSPGWTEEQQQQVAALWARALELSIAVGTHPFWSTVAQGKVAEARMALRRVHEPAGDEAAADGTAAA
ncbi:hypothetical protein HCK01_26310, partial [Streptomyces sp. AA8]|uniref:hypothetical protein n=1 Tax=Streptomyces telluris TaxID=2720021 RepID=UPI001439C605